MTKHKFKKSNKRSKPNRKTKADSFFNTLFSFLNDKPLSAKEKKALGIDTSANPFDPMNNRDFSPLLADNKDSSEKSFDDYFNDIVAT